MDKDKNGCIDLLTQYLHGFKKGKDGVEGEVTDKNKQEAKQRIWFLSVVSDLLKQHGLNASNLDINFDTKTININADLDMSVQLEIIEKLNRAITLK